MRFSTYIRSILGVTMAAAALSTLHGSMATTRSPPAELACANSTAPRAFSIALGMIARGATRDPAAIWSDDDIWNPNTPRGTDIWLGKLDTCDGTLLVSQIVNRQCASASECPVRVVLVDANANRRVLLYYRQMCSRGDAFAVSANLARLSACDIVYPLR
jgi:hypothetical protein